MTQERKARNQQAFVQSAKEAGLCKSGKKHGPATHGRMCDACYAKHKAGSVRIFGRGKPGRKNHAQDTTTSAPSSSGAP